MPSPSHSDQLDRPSVAETVCFILGFGTLLGLGFWAYVLMP